MASRLKLVLPNTVSEIQTCCTIEKDIADTIVSVRDMIDRVEIDNLDGYIVKIYHEKAFYRVDHDYFFDVLDT